ncbi:MAG: hypothetical protein JXI33_03850 [Candidatus Aminicenantes bacterium]|nr:hypothetical protein [Candidatus Aminicenantes bacterium]
MGTPWIDYLFKVAVYLGAAYFFYRFLLRDDVNFLGNRLFLLFMLPFSFLLPLAPLQSPFRALTLTPEALMVAASMPTADAPMSAPIILLIVTIYWAGVAVFMLRILFHLFHLYRLQRRHPRERLHNVILVRVAAPIPPFSFFNRIFLPMPKNLATGEIEQIIFHESVHIRQLHSLDILVMELVVALQWFNPVVWFYRKALKETHEYLADREVIAQGFNADGYRLLLFEQQFGAKLFEFASHLKQSQIKRRMFMMNRMKRARKAPVKIILALSLIALLALALAEPRLIMAKSTTVDDKNEVTQKQDKSAMSDQELKDLQVKLDAKEKALKEKLAATDDPEEKQKLKQALDSLYKKRQVLMIENGSDLKEAAMIEKQLNKKKLEQMLLKLDEKEKYLKELYSQADTPGKKEKIKQDLDVFYKKRQVLLKDSGMTVKPAPPSREELQKKLQAVHEKRMQLKQIISEEKDPDKVRDLNLKFDELSRIEEKLQVMIDRTSQKLS